MYYNTYELYHYGMPRRSGRYPWGSGEHPFQHEGDFLNYIGQLKSEGLTETQIAKHFGLSTTQLRTQERLAKNERRAYKVATAKSLYSDGLNISEIGRKMGINESSVRSLLNTESERRTDQAQNTAKLLMDMTDEKQMIDVGTGVERELGVSKGTLDQALYICELEGYKTYTYGMNQLTNKNQQTLTKVMCSPDIQPKEGKKVPAEVYDYDKVSSIADYHSDDGGVTFNKLSPPKSINSSRVMIRYAEDGGTEKDGTIELRRGVEDISLGNSSYAQVRIAVDDSHYLKGMALYSNDEMPEGVDIIFNTNKHKGTPMMGEKDNTVLKPLKSDPDNPFGATIMPVSKDSESDEDIIFAGGQRWYTDENGNKQLSVINKIKNEGDWNNYKKTLSSQFLGKQSLNLISKQLDLSYATKKAEYEDIISLNNPTIKRLLLKEFANECDGASVDLYAAPLPGQSWKVILPVTSLKDNEIYAPNYISGQRVALVRYPHGGTFEIPILTVNNKQKDAKIILGNATDAVGINSQVAARLSGADFDGDTVLVIPINSKTKIISTPALEGLKDFDPKAAYPYKEGMKVMSKQQTQKEMGKISNLITDMTLKGADEKEIARAVRHSMVVIDAEKHKLNYIQSEIDNGISSLKDKYQGHYNEKGNWSRGASTLLSRASAPIEVPETTGEGKINPETGKVEYKLSNRTYQKVDKKTGKIIFQKATKSSTPMAETDDAHTLSSGTPQEELYSDYANKLKALANQARKESLSTGKLEYSPSAKNTYQKEVDLLNSKLNIALKNAPREREAQRIATVTSKAKRQDNPDMSAADYKRLKQQCLNAARITTGAQKTRINITDKEWEAIQAGAISDSKLVSIISNSDSDKVRQLATPKSIKTLSNGKIAKIKAMLASGYTIAEIAQSVGCSESTVIAYK